MWKTVDTVVADFQSKRGDRQRAMLASSAREMTLSGTLMVACLLLAMCLLHSTSPHLTLLDLTDELV